MKLLLRDAEKTIDPPGTKTGYDVVLVDPPPGVAGVGRDNNLIMSDEPYYNIAPERALAELLVAAFNAHDHLATALTGARKLLSTVLATNVAEFDHAALKESLNEAITTLNLCIVASRKVAKGELP